MNVKRLKRLIYDMANVIEAHGLQVEDPTAATVLQDARNALAGNDEVEFMQEDHARMIELIRQANSHPLAA